jgi:DUF4097 and DUF4098 domain-containing protein YvlB
MAGCIRVSHFQTPGFSDRKLGDEGNAELTNPVYGHMTCAVMTGALIFALAFGSACMVSVDSQAEVVREERRFTVSGTPELRLATFDGAIEIQSWDKPDVFVEIEKRGATREAVAELEVRVNQSGNRIELEVKRPRSEGFGRIGLHHSASAKLIVSVPPRADIWARSGDGSIRIERVTGTMELRTGDGSIHATDVNGQLTLNTGDGSINVDRAEGRLDLNTGDGGVNVSGKLTAVKLHTGDGSIVYRAEQGTAMSDDWEITTGDGGVTLYLPREFSAELDAHTGDGGISNELNVSAAGGGEVSRRTVRGRIGDGGKLLRIRTGDGSIRLHMS